MATIAKGSITLVNVNDAYSVLFTPDSCAIKADFDGTNPDLTNAYTDITVVRGEEKHTFKLTLASFSNTAITYQQTAIDAYTKRIRLTSIPSDVLSGALTFTITTDDEFVADVTFTYSVIRETSMLDWILDWESNKTVIGGSYLISPKIFVGKKVENEEGLKSLTGVYIGPDDTNTAGIYGYKEGKDVFHINAKGAMLGGWSVLSDCITTSNDSGTIKIGADGNIIYRTTNKSEFVWGLFQDGSAAFAKGNVTLNRDGSASFTGEIQAFSGNIGGWTIGEGVLYNDNIALNSAKHIIGVGGATMFDVNDIKTTVQQFGGVYMFYENANSYGLQGYLQRKSVGENLYEVQNSFSLGSVNHIANWSFDTNSLYIGIKTNTQRKYTESSGDITIGSEGMRGNSWYIDADGSVSFLKGEVQFTALSGSMVGWNLNAKRLSNSNVAIVSDTANAGIFMSVSSGTDFNSLASSSLTNYIDANGGIYMKTKTDGVSFAAYDQNGYKIFKLRSNGVSSIADWNIENDALFVGSKKVNAGTFTDSAGSMTLSCTGIRGNKWRLEADGSGAVADGNIQWDKDGSITFADSVSMQWNNGIQVAQMMAYGQMLYRDPEFTKDKKNGTQIYAYNSFDFCTFSASQLAIAMRNHGLLLKGTALVTRVDLIHQDDSTETIFVGSKQTNTDTTTDLMGVISTVVETDTVRISYTGEDAWLQAEAYDDDGNSLGWLDLCGKDNILGEQVITVSRELVEDETAPNSTQKAVKFTDTRWITPVDFRLGGFMFGNLSRANGKYVVKIVAKIPVGWKIENYHNSYGNGGKTKWITSQLGTDSYMEYMCIVTCGSIGAFKTINHFALTLVDNLSPLEGSDFSTNIRYSDGKIDYDVPKVEWYVAYATIFDATSSEKSTTTIDIHGIYTGTLSADQIVAGKIDTKLLDVEDILASGQITAAQVLCPFVPIKIPDNYSSYCGFNLSKAYNSLFAPSDKGHYIFLPCDISQSGRTITIHYAKTDQSSVPQIILCDNINARFLLLYQFQSIDPQIRAVQLTAGQTIQMIAIPHRADINDTNAFVDWYLIGYSDELSKYIETQKDDVITDDLWNTYHNQIVDII